MKESLAQRVHLSLQNAPPFLRSPHLHVVVALAYVCFSLVLLRNLDGLVDTRFLRLVGRDFFNFWTASNFATTDHLDLLYDLDAFHRAQELFLGHALDNMPFCYPPAFLIILSPFSFLPYLDAYILWIALGFACYLASMRFLHPQLSSLAFLLALSPASLENIAAGQNGFLTTACLVTGIRFSKQNSYLAGLCFGVLVIKPHLALLVPILLLTTKSWKTLIVAAGTSTFSILFSFFLYGENLWADYLIKMIPLQRQFLTTELSLPFHFLAPSPFYAFKIIGLPIETAGSLQAIISSCCALLAYFLFKKTEDVRLHIAVFGSIIFIFSPYTLNYDMPLLAAACLALAATRSTFSYKANAVLIGAWLLPLYLEWANRNHITIGPLILASLIILTSWQILFKPRLQQDS